MSDFKMASLENIVTVIGIILIAIYAPGNWKLLALLLIMNINTMKP